VNDGLSDRVRDVLRDTLNLPAEFLSFLPQYIAQNPVSTKPIPAAKATPVYSASITPDASQGVWQTITVTNGTAFTINAPTNTPDSSHTKELAIEVVNSSGGAMGAITWNAAFVFTNGAFVNPANTKKRHVRFEWNGSNWIETARALADY